MHAILPCDLMKAVSHCVVACLITSCSCDRAPWVLHAYAKKLGRIFRLRVVHWHFVVVTDPAEALRLTSRSEATQGCQPGSFHPSNECSRFGRHCDCCLSCYQATMSYWQAVELLLVSYTCLDRPRMT